MKRSLWLIFVALALIAAGILLRYEPDRLAANTPADRQLPDVRVQHEFVRIPVAAAEVPPISRGRAVAHRGPGPNIASADEAPSTATPPAPTPPPVQRAKRDRTLLEKARRAFVGDGRYRPEPFPRVR